MAAEGIPLSRTDWRGNTYTVGDTVLVPMVGYRSSRWMGEGPVVKFTPQRVVVDVKRASDGWAHGKRAFTPDNVTVLREPF